MESPRPAVLNALKESERLLNAGQWKDSEALLQKKLVPLSPLSLIEQWEKYHFRARYFLHYNRNLDSASSNIKSMAEIGRRAELPAVNLATMLFCEGDFYFAQRKYEKAFRSYHKGELFVSGNLSPCDQAPFVHHLGLVRYHQRDYTVATELIKKALRYSGQCNDRSSLSANFAIRQGAMNSLMLAYHKRGMLDSAVFYGKQAKGFIVQHQALDSEDSVFHAVALGVVLGNLGEVQAAQGSHTDAEDSFEQSILLNDRPGYAAEDAQGTKLKLAALHLKQGNPAKAGLVLSSVAHRLENLNVSPAQKRRLEASMFRLRSQISAMSGDMAKAYEMAENYHGLKDSIEQADLELFGTDLDVVFDSIDRENRMAIVDRNSRLKNIYLIATALAIIFGAVFILYILRILRRSKANVYKLNRLNQRLSETVGELRLIQQENQALLKVVTHDLRNPIGGINTIIGLMLDEPGRTADDQETLGIIKSSGEVALSLIEKLLEANPEVSMSCTQVRLDIVLSECIALFDYKAAIKGQYIGHQLTEANVYANRGELVRVVSNLLANAIKFSPFGSGIFVSMHLTDQGVEVVVRDHGAGVSQEKRKTIFDMDSGPGELGTDGEKSFGIGLSISKKILRAYNGKIGFRDAEGNGTEFFFVLPLL